MKVGKIYSRQIENIEKLAAGPSLWQNEANDVLNRAKLDCKDTDSFLQLLHEIQRLNKVSVSGLGNNEAFRSAVAGETVTWKDFTAPPVDLSLQHALAKKLYNIRLHENDIGFIKIGSNGREIGKWLVEECLQHNTPFIVSLEDTSFDNLVLNHADEQGVKDMAASHVKIMETVTRVMSANSGTPEKKPVFADKDKAQLYAREVSPFSNRISSGEVFYTLTSIPTSKDAEIDGIDYKDYLKLFFEMCDQPWAEISKAQKSLIEEFNAASKVRITNKDGTDVSMELTDTDGSHFTFCNSLIAKNVPGSEIFSAPRLDSVEGIIVSEGRFRTHAGKIVENLTLEFEKGRLVRYHAEKGLDAFEEEISVDAGARGVGELGIGTNPHLKQHVANGLLVEKIGGSFHLALGRPYTYTEYEGEPVKVDNGGKSALHWDITTMLHGKEGRIYLDGRLVMDNGQWLDKKYEVLNRGWEAVPEKDRPGHWRAKPPRP